MLDTIAAKTYDSSGAVDGTVATYTDDGTKTPNTNMHPLSTGEETIALVNLDQVSDRGLHAIGMLSLR